MLWHQQNLRLRLRKHDRQSHGRCGFDYFMMAYASIWQSHHLLVPWEPLKERLKRFRPFHRRPITKFFKTGHVNSHFNGPFTLKEDLCDFKNCIFEGESTSGEFISANNAALKVSFVSCLFVKISVSGQYFLVSLYDAAEGILDRCCFAEVNCYLAAYATGYSARWSIPKASLNSTVVVNYRGREAPFWGGYNEYTSFFNNNSHSITTRLRSCYCVVRMPQNRDSTNCFFSGCSCVGPHPVDIHPDFGGCILLKFNFVNNSDSNGYFQLVYGGIETVIKELVISFTFTPAKWTFNVAPGPN